MKIRMILAVLLVSVVCLPASAAAASTQVLVTPGDLNDWTLTNSATSSTTFVSGPDTPPLGTGSLELSVGTDGDGAAQARNANYHGTRLDTLTALSYQTYVSVDGPGGQLPYIILSLDFDGDEESDDLLFFEPVYQNGGYNADLPDQGDTAVGVWQSWDALNGGWWSVNGVAGAGPGVDIKSISDYLAVQPNATIVNTSSGLGGVRFVAGFGAGAWDDVVGNIDAVQIAVEGGSDVIYDFEVRPAVPGNQADCKNGGWQEFSNPSFKNQGQCVRYVVASNLCKFMNDIWGVFGKQAPICGRAF